MKAAYIQKTIYLIFFLAVLFSAGCGTKDRSEPDPIGIKIKSPKFDEISTIYSAVEVSLKFTNSNSGGVTECNVFIGTDTKVKGTCGDMSFGTYAYILEYRYQGLSIAKSIGSITIDEDNTETPITLLDKSIDEDNDGCSNLQEVIVGSNPLVQDTCIPPPSDLTAKSISTTRIDLTWTGSSRATGYKIFRRDGSDGADTEIGTSTQTSYSDTGLNADTTYCYKVSANGNGAESIPTDLVCAKTESGLVAFYPFNGNANDESGNGNNGVVNGATLAADRFGKVNSAYSFDGVNDYIDLPTLTGIDATTSNAKTTVTFWMYWNGGNAQMPFSFNSSCLYLLDGMLGFNTGNSDHYVISLTGLANKWVHVTAVFNNGSVNANSLFIDGIAHTLTQRQNPSVNRNVSTSVKIGRSHNENSYYFNGLIDDVRIYNRALTDAEILTLYNEVK